MALLPHGIGSRGDAIGAEATGSSWQLKRFIPSHKTSECFNQIFADLDSAIYNMSDVPVATGANAGRIDKCAAMSFKGRVLLMWASPLFNPSGDNTRWQAAYEANKAALDFLSANGKGMNPNFHDIWFTPLNSEVIIVRQYQYPNSTWDCGKLLPGNIWAAPAIWYSADSPTLELVNAFPMKDGSAWNPATMSYDTLWRHRDPRFYETVMYNGANIGLGDFVKAGCNFWSWETDPVIIQQPEGSIKTWTSFHRNKMLDRKASVNTMSIQTTPCIDMRYTEVYMAYGEAANEVDKPAEALQVLYDVRKRAGIDKGTGNYGITAATKADIREAYLKERFVEFAFENKRWDDLRRCRRFDIINNIGQRHGLQIVIDPARLNDFQDGLGPQRGENIEQFWDIFTSKVKNVESDDVSVLNVPDTYYFYPIPQSEIDMNSKLEQNIGWNNGTFDPLQ